MISAAFSDHPNSDAPSTAPAPSHRRMLVVDDLAFLRTTIHRLLSRIGFAEIVQAKSGTEALRILGGGEFACILTDYMMPNVTGLRLLQLIRSGDLGCRRDVPVVLLTGYAEQMVIEAAQALHASSVIPKPCSARTLRGGLERALATPIPLKSPEFYRRVAVPDMQSRQAREERAQSSGCLLGGNAPAVLRAVDLIAARREREGRYLSAPVLDPKDGGDQAVVQRRLTRLVPISELRAGTVIAEELVSTSGKTLVTEGTILSHAIIDRLHELGTEVHIRQHVRIYI